MKSLIRHLNILKTLLVLLLDLVETISKGESLILVQMLANLRININRVKSLSIVVVTHSSCVTSRAFVYYYYYYL